MKKLLVISLLFIGLSSCHKDKNEVIQQNEIETEKPIYIPTVTIGGQCNHIWSKPYTKIDSLGRIIKGETKFYCQTRVSLTLTADTQAELDSMRLAINHPLRCDKHKNETEEYHNHNKHINH